MEPEVKALFVRIIKSLSFTVLWMLVNMTLGIFFDLGFPHGGISTWNILFYIFMLATLAVLIWYLLKIWSENPEAETGGISQ